MMENVVVCGKPYGKTKVCY